MAALAGQVLAVSEEAGGPAALQRQPGVDEGGGAAVVVHKERLRNRSNVDKLSSFYCKLDFGFSKINLFFLTNQKIIEKF